MNCQDFELIILPLARNQLLDATTREQGLAHTKVCARCAARLAEERALIAGLRAVATKMAEVEAPARLESALLAAFRKHATAAPVIIPMPAKTRYWSQWMLVAAAVILVLVSVVVIFRQRSGLPNQKQEVQVILPKPAKPQEATPEQVTPAPDGESKIAYRPITRQNPNHRHPRRSNLSETEVTTVFFPLMDGEDLSLLGSIQVVRVELPGSALLAVGLPVDAMMANEPIKADVILGHDGMAHAIRFVR